MPPADDALEGAERPVRERRVGAGRIGYVEPRLGEQQRRGQREHRPDALDAHLQQLRLERVDERVCVDARALV